jgi:endonuclease/exonuclease/phosphatase family metal-dependent hydrolase
MTMTPPKPNHTRLVTYNIRKCLGLDLRRRPDRIMQVLAASQADVAVLQEADRRLPPRPSSMPHDMLAQFGWQAVGLGGAGSLGWHGNGIIFRNGSILDQGHLPLPGLEPRGAVWAALNLTNGPVVVVGLHLGLLAASRRRQIHALSGHRAALPDFPVIWAGDFNDWSNGPFLDDAVPDMKFAAPLPSFPAARPMGALDRVAVGQGLTIVDHGVLRARPARIASDHLPVWADMAHDDGTKNDGPEK